MLRRLSGGSCLVVFLVSVCLLQSARADEQPTSKFVPPKLVHRVEAAYPEEARRQGLTGTVLLQLVIGADGQVQSVAVAHGAGHGFDEAAVAAAKQLRFEPATQDGAPIAVQINYEVHFALAPTPTLKDEAHPQAPPAEAVHQTTIDVQRPYTAASATTVRDQDFLLRPRLSPEDILQVVPGLVTAQHQGGGKADQIFLRGFDADHGTDVAVYLDGIPVNMPSHAHGQGYTDLHFLIPEVIQRMEIQKGPYSAEHGDFATAGSVNLVTRDTFDKSQVTVQSGSFGTARVLGILAPEAGSLHPWFAAELYRTDGPFQHSEELLRYNLFGKVSYDLTPTVKVSLLGTAYASSWVGSGQIPAHLVDEGFLDQYGAIDPTEGGNTQRQQLILALTAHPDAQTRFTGTLSVIRYNLALFNDFTFQLRDPVNGDEIEQDDQRTTLAADFRFDRSIRDSLPGVLVATAGAQVRNDSITASLWHVHQRVRLPQCFDIANPCVNTTDDQTDAAAYAQGDWTINKHVRIVGGVRADVFEFDVHSLKPDGTIDDTVPSQVKPTVQAAIVSPKLSAVFTPIRPLDLYLNFGSGFHSNDARSVVESNGVGALPRALGGELGARTRLRNDRLNLAAAFWVLHLDSEQVWNGDTGGTEPAGPTIRYGVDLEGRWSILPWLFADVDLSLAHAQYVQDAGNGNAVALAPPLVLTAGLTARHPSGFGGSLRLRHISARPGNQFTPSDGVPACTPDLDASTPAGQRCYLIAEGYTVLDATLGYTSKRWAVMLILTNLTDTQYREAQFGDIAQVVSPPGGHTVSSSGQPWVPETHPVQDIYFTPGNPIGALLQASYFF